MAQEKEFVTIHEPDGGFHRLHKSQFEDYEPNKETDINKYDKQKKEVESQHKPVKEKYNPQDVSGKVGEMKGLARQYKDEATEVYGKVKPYIDQHKDELKNLDISNEKEVVEKATELIRKIIPAENKDYKPELGLRCDRTAGGIAAILDSLGIKYTCYIGATYPLSKRYPMKITGSEKEKLLMNHVWIEINGKPYENFIGYKNEPLSHQSFGYKIKFKEGK